MTRQPRLNQNAPTFDSAPRSPGNLAQKLEAALRCTEIGQIDSNVSVNHPDESDVRKVQPLRDHLGAEQDVDLTRGNAVEDSRVRPFPTCGVDVHPRYP